MRVKLLLIGAVLMASAQADAEIVFNEIMSNAPGGDNTREYFEILSTAGVESLNGLWYLSIEGDGPSASGTVDQALDLSAFSTGTNGLFLWRDAAPPTGLVPSLDPATVVNSADFNPDIENGSITHMLVRNFTGAVGMDLDAGADGIFDSTPWDSIVDSIAVLENDAPPNTGYGSSIFPISAFGATTFTMFRVAQTLEWVAVSGLTATVGTTYPVSYVAGTGSTLSGAAFDLTSLTSMMATPGGLNPSVAAVPEPSCVLLLSLTGIGGVVAARRRRNGNP